MFIYTFHMPAFIFVSGLFSKKTVNAEKLNWMKLFPYLYMCLLLAFLRYLSKFIYQSDRRLELLKQSTISWFLFALFIYFVAAHAFRKYDRKYVMSFAVILALIAGYDSHVGTLFALSRVVCYFPFFYLGYCLDPKKLEEKLKKRSNKIISAVILIGYACVCIFAIHPFYNFRRLITCQNAYATLPYTYGAWMGLLRLAYYAVALAVMMSVFCLVPSRRIKHISEYGSRTLAVYFWHLPIMEILMHSLYGAFTSSLWAWLGLSLLFSVVLVLLLSQEVFSRPLNWLMHPKLSKVGELEERKNDQ